VRLYHQLLEWFEIANYVHLYAVDVTVDHIVFSRVDHAEEYLHLLVLGSNVLCGLQRLRYERDSGNVDLIFFRSSVVLTNPDRAIQMGRVDALSDDIGVSTVAQAVVCWCSYAKTVKTSFVLRTFINTISCPLSIRDVYS
jgi:hypothetical protein